MAETTLNVAVLGDSGVGKTKFIGRHLIGEFGKLFFEDGSYTQHPLKFHTNHLQLLRRSGWSVC